MPMFTAISDSDLSGPEKALITQLRQAECDKRGRSGISSVQNTNRGDLEKHYRISHFLSILFCLTQHTGLSKCLKILCTL